MNTDNAKPKAHGAESVSTDGLGVDETEVEQLQREILQWAEEQAACMKWLQEKADRGQVQIAKSLFGGGYEIAIVPSKGFHFVKAYLGDLHSCLRQAMAIDRKEK